LPAVKDEKEPELDFNFKPIGLLNDESSNAYPFINYGTVASTDTLYDELWKLDIFPEMESLTHPARIEYNEQANVFTTSGHFKILDSAFNVVYELTDHMGTEVHHLDTEPIAVVSDQINISFIHLKTFELLNRYNLYHKDEFVWSSNADEFCLIWKKKDSLYVHSFQGVDIMRRDTIKMNAPVTKHTYSYSLRHQHFVGSHYNTLHIEDFKTGAINSKELSSKIGFIKFVNNDQHLLIERGYAKGELMELYTYPELELIRSLTFESYGIKVVETEECLGFFSAENAGVLINYEGEEIYKGPGDSEWAFGYFEGKAIRTIRKGMILNLVSTDVKTLEDKVLNTFCKSSIKLDGFMNDDKTLVYRFGQQMFYYNLDDNVLNEVPNFKVGRIMTRMALDPFSNRLSYQDVRKPNEFYVLNIEDGTKSTYNFNGGAILFTSHKDTVIGVGLNAIYKYNLNTQETDTLKTYSNRNFQAGGVNVLNIKQSKHPTLNATYINLDGSLQLIDLDNLEIKEWNIGAYFLGSKNDSLVYINGEKPGLMLMNLNTGDMRSLKKEGKYHFTFDFKSGQNSENAYYGMSHITLFDPSFQNRYQYVGYRDYRCFSNGSEGKFFVTSFEDDLYLYKKRD